MKSAAFVRLHLLALAIAPAVPAVAVDSGAAPSQSTERRLSAEEVDKILEEAARKREKSVWSGEPEPESEDVRTPVHGEVGFSVGTGGYRSAFGTAVVPLTGGGSAIISVGTSRGRDHNYWGW